MHQQDSSLAPPSSQAPHYVSWEITHRCDARCVYCYASAGPDAEASNELTTAEALTVIDQLADSGGLILAFSGGEPLLRPDWRQLMRYAMARRLVVTVITNGSSIGRQEAAELSDLEVESVTVSLDSHRPEVHDSLRRLPGLHARAVSAIRHLIAQGVRVVVNFTPIRQNWLDLRGVTEFVHSLGADALSLSEYVPVGRGTSDMSLDPEDLRSLIREWEELREIYRGRLTLAANDRTVAMLQTADDAGCTECGAAYSAARIDPEGTVNPCAFLTLPLGSLRSETLAEVWRRAGQVRDAQARSGGSGNSCAACGLLHRSQG